MNICSRHLLPLIFSKNDSNFRREVFPAHETEGEMKAERGITTVADKRESNKEGLTSSPLTAIPRTAIPVTGHRLVPGLYAILPTIYKKTLISTKVDKRGRK
jgi:hypothetical protein